LILEDLTLHDFGVYRDRQTINLAPPSRAKPVVLVGGLNGAGKTTLLDALQLCLFGPLARCSSRRDLGYEEFLARSIHRKAGTNEAALELSFRYMSEGNEQTFRVHRSWARTGKGCRERLEILRNGEFDRIATEHWNEQAEEFLPARIAHLFLFDGEKIEACAEPASSSELIGTAIYGLLGLDLVERLSSDLLVLERRKRLEQRPEDDQVQVGVLEKALAETKTLFEAAHQKNASLRGQLDRERSKLTSVEARYRKDGGELFDRRMDIEAEAKAAQSRLQLLEKEMRDLAAGAAPLALVYPLLKDVESQDLVEASSERAEEVLQVLEDRDAQLMAFLEGQELPKKAVSAISAQLKKDRVSRQPSAEARYLTLGADGRNVLKECLLSELPSVKDRLKGLISAEAAARREHDDFMTKVSAIPAEDALAKLVGERSDILKQIAKLEAELVASTAEVEHLRRDADRKSSELERLHAERAQSDLAQRDVERVVKHSEKVRTTLQRFKGAMVERHIGRIEGFILNSFQQLMRKSSLISRLTIDPHTFGLQLFASNGDIITPERLSAGERQLLAVAILWGLAQASGRPLPAIIDTPLGRLDSSHRHHLVSRYFPYASHQVILLSTDEELTGQYLDTLKPFIGRSYELAFEEARGGTVIRNGYFGESAAHGH
jgi:DNA sulfur modification protein DndD